MSLAASRIARSSLAALPAEAATHFSWPGPEKRPSFAPQGSPVTPADIDRLAKLVTDASGKLVCLTGAGLSTESGVPDYRGPEGSYSKGHVPMKHAQFVSDSRQRARYWARSLAGWRFFASARPNAAHNALAALERHGYVRGVVTQNVDGLHQQAGTQNVIDLHGRNDEVACMQCGTCRPRRKYQEELEVVNRDWMAEHLTQGEAADVRADGDAHLSTSDFRDFVVPACSSCGGIWKPRVVFFGGALDPAVRDAAHDLVEGSSSLLVLGTTVQVFSSFRLVKASREAGKTVVIINIGETRADKLVPPELQLPLQCGPALSALCAELGAKVGAQPSE